MKFKKGDKVYYRNRAQDTTLYIVEQVGKAHSDTYTRHRGMIRIRDNSPNAVAKWVGANDCIPHSDPKHEEWEQLDTMRVCFERKHFFDGDCVGCGKEFESDETNKDNAVQEFYDEGWREYNSEYYELIGFFCPECLQIEKERK